MQLRFSSNYQHVWGLAFGALFALGVSVTSGQDSAELDLFREMHGELRQRMENDLDDATKFLNAKIAAEPNSVDLNVLRHSLAARLASERRFDEANQQFGQLLDFQIERVKEGESQFGIWMTIQSLRKIAEQSGNDDVLRLAVDRGLEALGALPRDHEPQPLVPLSQLTVLKAQLMANDGKPDQAMLLVTKELKRLSGLNESESSTEETAQALVRMLRSLTSADRGNDSWRETFIPQLDRVVTDALDQYPQSQVLQNSYAETQFLMITQWDQDDPDATKQRIETVTKRLASAAIKNVSARATLRRIQVHKERMEAVKPVSSLVGKPAPDWDIDAWVNAKGVTEEGLRGKVLLIDFWAMWCGPCVATFPHLRQWREEFGDRGFEIVGVTQYYNFQWDDENKRASRASEDVSPAEERETLKSFLEHHRLKHPVIVSPEDSEMGSQYGVRGIPHVVLVDRQGIVQFVKTGAGADTAKQIHDKIKELVAKQGPT